MAQQLSGYDQAAETLTWLHRNRLFTERRLQARAEASYEFHPLFREFLLARARAQLPAAVLAELQQKAAALLEDSGRTDEAVALWRSARDWQALQQLVLAAGAGVDDAGSYRHARGLDTCATRTVP